MNQQVRFSKELPSSEDINKKQDFEWLLSQANSDLQEQNSDTTTLNISLFDKYKELWVAAAAVLIFTTLGIGFWMSKTPVEIQPLEVAYIVSQKDLAQAERLSMTDRNDSYYSNLPIPQGTTTILEQNASPENASLENVAYILREELNCPILTRSKHTQPKFISFVVSSEGQITKLEANGCEAQVKKTLSKFPNWKAGSLEGQKLSQRIVVMI